MRDRRTVVATDDEVVAIGHGKLLERDERFVGEGPWGVVDVSGRLLAVYAPHRSGAAKPDVVLAPAG